MMGEGPLCSYLAGIMICQVPVPYLIYFAFVKVGFGFQMSVKHLRNY
jgi:hypothetical protein